jgi:hypothetical protein
MARTAAEAALASAPNCTARAVLSALGGGDAPCEPWIALQYPPGYHTSRRPEAPSEVMVESEVSSGAPKLPERGVRSLVRLCLEPMAWRIAPQTKPEIDLHVAVFADGVRHVTANFLGGIEAPELEDCLEKMAPVVLHASKQSIRATIRLFAATEP